MSSPPLIAPPSPLVPPIPPSHLCSLCFPYIRLHRRRISHLLQFHLRLSSRPPLHLGFSQLPFTRQIAPLCLPARESKTPRRSFRLFLVMKVRRKRSECPVLLLASWQFDAPNYEWLRASASRVCLHWNVCVLVDDLDLLANPLCSSIDTKSPNPKVQK